mmetsp:Transcript_2030/g.4775  ORF Transcript_2030/g.4775 Transcript_2030/m.4775 type:complete len:218 (-) Transcript_2030:300-953(-)
MRAIVKAGGSLGPSFWRMSLATRPRSLRCPRTPINGRSCSWKPRKRQASRSSTCRASLLASTTFFPDSSWGVSWYSPTSPSSSDTSRITWPSASRSLLVNVHHLACGCFFTNSIAPGRTRRWITDLIAVSRSNESQYSTNSRRVSSSRVRGMKVGSCASSCCHQRTHLITSSTSFVPSPTSLVWSMSHTRCSSESPGYVRIWPCVPSIGSEPYTEHP